MRPLWRGCCRFWSSDDPDSIGRSGLDRDGPHGHATRHAGAGACRFRRVCGATPMAAISSSSAVAAAIWPRSFGMTGSGCRFTPSAWTAEGSSGHRPGRCGVDLGGADGVHAGRDRLAQSATDMAAQERGLSGERKYGPAVHFRAPQITQSMIHCVVMDAARAALARENAALKAELAVARAKASEDVALIAQQKLRIAKLERQIYGQRSERSARLIDQLALIFEELEASATEDELAAERAVAKTTTVRGFTRRRCRAQHLPRPPAARARGDRSADGVRMLWRHAPAQTGRGRDAHAGIDAASVEGDRDGAGEVHLPGLREDQPGAGAVPCDHRGRGRGRACWR